MPSNLLTDGALILFAAALLITPGLITDVVGLTLMIPYTRNGYKHLAMKMIRRHFKVQVHTSKSAHHEGGVVDGEVVYSSDEKKF